MRRIGGVKGSGGGGGATEGLVRLIGKRRRFLPNRHKWYSHAWGTAFLASAAFFALGWVVKGSNPLPSLSSRKDDPSNKNQPSSSDH